MQNNTAYEPGSIFIHKGTGERVVILRELDHDKSKDRGIEGRKFLVRGEDYSRLTIFEFELTRKQTTEVKTQTVKPA